MGWGRWRIFSVLSAALMLAACAGQPMPDTGHRVTAADIILPSARPADASLQRGPVVATAPLAKVDIQPLPTLTPPAPPATSGPSAPPAAPEPSPSANLTACLYGFAACKESNLSAEGRSRVQQAARERNFSACMAGFSSCREADLTPIEQARAKVAAADRNVSACVNGFSSCRMSDLTPPELERTRAAALRRNEDACLAGFSSCRSEELSPEVAMRVRAAAAERNVAACLSGFSWCREAELTPEQRQRIASVRTDRVEVQPPGPLPVPRPGDFSRPGCAENGSCYGDISALTGRPKTTHVSGYYRRDGTYVRSHYRSRR